MRMYMAVHEGVHILSHTAVCGLPGIQCIIHDGKK